MAKVYNQEKQCFILENHPDSRVSVPHVRKCSAVITGKAVKSRAQKLDTRSLVRLTLEASEAEMDDG